MPPFGLLHQTFSFFLFLFRSLIFRALPCLFHLAALFFCFRATHVYLYRFRAQLAIFEKDVGTHNDHQTNRRRGSRVFVTTPTENPEVVVKVRAATIGVGEGHGFL